MKAYNITSDEAQKALKAVNKRYKGNIIFNYLDAAKRGTAVEFTLRVKDSKRPGHRRGHSGRRMISACWHVHGHLFEELLKINPAARIITAYATVTKDGGNWEDRNIGSIIQPLLHSDACDCGKGEANHELREG